MTATGPRGLPLRRAARVILFDPDDRVLLVQFAWPGGSMWALPGGGIEAGETPEQAAAREIAEETGLPHSSLIGPVWLRTAIFDRMPGFDGQYEHYFAARAHSTELAPSMTAEELRAEYLAGAQWWPIDRIERGGETFAPLALGRLLRSLVAEGPPSSPLAIGN